MKELLTLPLGNYYRILEVGKGEDGKCYLFLDDYNSADKLEISHKLCDMILEEFGDKEED